MKFFITIIALSVVILTGLFPILTLAVDQADPAIDRLNNVLTPTGLYTATPASPATIAIRVIRIALGFVGLFFFIQILISGFQWMTSSANPEKIKKAKQRLSNALIGLIIILSAYLITVAITTYLLRATNPLFFG